MSLVKMYEIQFKLIFFKFLFLTLYCVKGAENNNNPTVMFISSIYTDTFKNYFSVKLLVLNQKWVIPRLGHQCRRQTRAFSYPKSLLRSCSFCHPESTLPPRGQLAMSVDTLRPSESRFILSW